MRKTRRWKNEVEADELDFEDCKLRISVKAYINLNIAREEAAAQLRKTFLRQQAAHQSSFEDSLLRISVKDTINLNICNEAEAPMSFTSFFYINLNIAWEEAAA